MAGSISSFRYLKTAASLAFDALREGRLPLSPKRWLVDLRHLREHMADHAAAPRLLTPEESAALTQAFVDACRQSLVERIRTGRELSFTQHDEPIVSVLLVLYNRAELTLHCLQTLQARVSIPFEIVIVDNHSTDETSTLLDRIHGPQILRQDENLGFLRACNIAARAARGRYLLFLNNDTEVQPGSVEAALDVIEGDGAVGAVGGRLVFPDGRLQEAGSIIWKDGASLGYGRGDAPDAPQYSYVRDVDYCSAAFLLTPRVLFLESGGFDERYQPAYYEDADYCVRLWKAGRRVVYEPRATVVHVEFASSSSASSATTMQLERRTIFVDIHRDWLAAQSSSSAAAVLTARSRLGRGQRVLVIDDRVPHGSVGFGDPRALALLRSLTALGHSVTLYPVSATREDWEDIYRDVPHEVEVFSGHGARGLAPFFRDRSGYYGCIIVSRSHNMALLRAKLGDPRAWADHARVVYDAEAITATRDVQRRRLLGESVSEVEAGRLIADELSLAKGVAAVLAVSAEEQRQFEGVNPGRVHVVSHGVEVAPTTRPFSQRSGMLFVGSFHELSPNADAVLWFIREVLPLIRKRVHGDVRLTVAGKNPPRELLSRHDGDVNVVGSVADLKPLYDKARVFVAPTRFASGIPIKVIHAAANGLPAVATSLLAKQLVWQDGRELLQADSPEDFASACASLHQHHVLWDRVRTNALDRVQEHYSTGGFTQALRGALPACQGDDLIARPG